MREVDLVGYLPPVLVEIREIRAAADAQTPELAALGRTVQRLLDEQFVHSARDEGILRWEAILGIAVPADDSLEVRRFRVLGRLNEQLPFTIRRLREMLEALTGAGGYEIELDAGRYLLRVRLALTAKRMLAEADALLRRVVPANLVVLLSLAYNTHRMLRPHTHAALSKHTHDNLKGEVLT